MANTRPLDVEENLFNTVITREEELIIASFSRSINTTDDITDVSLDQCLYLFWAIGSVTSFSERTYGFPTLLEIYSPIICFPDHGSCPSKEKIQLISNRDCCMSYNYNYMLLHVK